jgi:hypothetical protein
VGRNSTRFALWSDCCFNGWHRNFVISLLEIECATICSLRCTNCCSIPSSIWLNQTAIFRGFCTVTSDLFPIRPEFLLLI